MARHRTGRPTRTRLAACVALLATALALPAAAQAPGAASGAAATKGSQMLYVLDIGGQSGLLYGVTGLSGAASLASGVAQTGAAKAPAGEPTLVLQAGHGLPPSFYGWVSSAVNGGKASRMTMAIVGTDTSGRVTHAATLSDASVVAVGFPALDTSSSVPFAMNVEVQGALRIDPVGKPLAKTTNELASRMASTRWVVSGYRLVIGKLNMAGLTRIEAFTLKPGGALQLELSTHGVTTQMLQAISPTAAAKDKNAPPAPALDGQLLLTSASGQVLATLALHEVKVASIAVAPLDPRSGANNQPGRAVLSAKQAQITFAQQIAQ